MSEQNNYQSGAEPYTTNQELKEYPVACPMSSEYDEEFTLLSGKLGEVAAQTVPELKKD